MNMMNQLMALATIWSRHNDTSLARLATIVVNDGKFFVRMGRANSNCNVTTFEKFLQYFRNSDHWRDSKIPTSAAAILDGFENVKLDGLHHDEIHSSAQSDKSMGQCDALSREDGDALGAAA